MVVSKVMERDLSEAHKTVKHAHYGSMQLNWDRHYSISLSLLYRKGKKNGNYITESIYFFQIGFVNLCACVAILLICFPPIQLPICRSPVQRLGQLCIIKLDKKQKIYNITPTLWDCSDHFSMAAVSPQFSRNISQLRRETAELFPLLVYTGGPAFNLSEIGCYKFIDDYNCFI